MADNIIFAGGGGGNCSLMMWPSLDKEAKPLIISRFNHGYSVYALAISPNATRIAAGTKPGLLRVHALSDFQASENSPALFEVYHLPAVTGLAFLTDDILASGGLDGHIKLWSISESRQLAEFEVHTNGVFALRQMGSLVLASIGGDGVLRVWDMDTLEGKYESEPFALPKFRGLTSLDYSFSGGLLIHPSGNGELHIYDPCNGFAKRVVHAHEGDFSAVACGSEYVITAGSQDTTIKLWPPSMDEPAAQVSAPLGVLTAAWAGIGSVMTGYTDGSSQIWKVDGELLPGPRLGELDLRCTISLPVDLVSRGQVKTNRQWRDRKLSQVKDIIADPGNRKQMTCIIDEFRHRGFSVEAGLILADAAKAQNQPLWELEARLKLAEGLGNSPAALPSMYALGRLLRKLKEPQLAHDCFEKILQIDENYLDVNEQISSLQSDPLMHLCPDKDIRSDLMQKGQILRQLEQYSILNKKFSWRLVVKAGKALSFNAHLNAQDATNSISTAVEEYEPDACSIALAQVSLFTGKELKDATWIYVSSKKPDMPIAFALEIHSTTRGSEFVPYEIFDTRLLEISAEMTAKEHNQQVKKAWAKLRRSSEAKDWLRNVSKASIESIRQLGDRSLAQTDDEF